MWGFTATLKKSNILRDQIRPAEPFLYNLGIKENGSWYQTGATKYTITRHIDLVQIYMYTSILLYLIAK